MNPKEYVVAGPKISDKSRLCIHQGENTHLGVMRSYDEGEFLPDEAVLLTRRGESNIYDVGPSVAELKKGPSKASSGAYRDGWDRIYGNHYIN